MPTFAISTSIGGCSVSWEGNEITGFCLPPAGEVFLEAPGWIEAVADRVHLHIAGSFQDFSDLPYAWERVSPFQRRIYEAALGVKAGQLLSYGGLCAAAGLPPASARAVGMALGQNPWPLLVPCHRFVGADGKMVGFSAPGGVQTKVRLLAIEGSQLFAE